MRDVNQTSPLLKDLTDVERLVAESQRNSFAALADKDDNRDQDPDKKKAEKKRQAKLHRARIREKKAAQKASRLATGGTGPPRDGASEETSQTPGTKKDAGGSVGATVGTQDPNGANRRSQDRNDGPSKHHAGTPDEQDEAAMEQGHPEHHGTPEQQDPQDGNGTTGPTTPDHAENGPRADTTTDHDQDGTMDAEDETMDAKDRAMDDENGAGGPENDDDCNGRTTPPEQWDEDHLLGEDPEQDEETTTTRPGSAREEERPAQQEE